MTATITRARAEVGSLVEAYKHAQTACVCFFVMLIVECLTWLVVSSVVRIAAAHMAAKAFCLCPSVQWRKTAGLSLGAITMLLYPHAVSHVVVVMFAADTMTVIAKSGRGSLALGVVKGALELAVRNSYVYDPKRLSEATANVLRRGPKRSALRRVSDTLVGKNLKSVPAGPRMAMMWSMRCLGLLCVYHATIPLGSTCFQCALIGLVLCSNGRGGKGN